MAWQRRLNGKLARFTYQLGINPKLIKPSIIIFRGFPSCVMGSQASLYGVSVVPGTVTNKFGDKGTRGD